MLFQERRGKELSNLPCCRRFGAKTLTVKERSLSASLKSERVYEENKVEVQDFICETEFIYSTFPSSRAKSTRSSAAGRPSTLCISLIFLVVEVNKSGNSKGAKRSHFPFCFMFTR